jgi:hypothetical protein
MSTLVGDNTTSELSDGRLPVQAQDTTVPRFQSPVNGSTTVQISWEKRYGGRLLYLAYTKPSLHAARAQSIHVDQGRCNPRKSMVQCQFVISCRPLRLVPKRCSHLWFANTHDGDTTLCHPCHRSSAAPSDKMTDAQAEPKSSSERA